jgi:hypothetical protein
LVFLEGTPYAASHYERELLERFAKEGLSADELPRLLKAADDR